MSPTPWICRSCARALRHPPIRQFARAASSAPGDSLKSPASFIITPALLGRAESLAAEHETLQRALNSSFDQAKAKRAGELSRVASALRDYQKAQSSVQELSDLLESEPESSDDAELASIARDELAAERENLTALERTLGASLTPRDPYSELPCMIEFRPGPGGTESRFFTDTLFQMYQRLCQRRGFRTNVLKYDVADGAGDAKSSVGELPLQEAVLEVSDPGMYDLFRSEAGMHRVQRIPSTESKGRVHTSVAAIWVLPMFPESGSGNPGDFNIDDPESDFYINPQDVRVETMRARGAGGQHVNKTESAIRITHIPTGEAVSMQDHRSQQRNRQEAWKVLRSRIADRRREQREAEAAQLRNSVLASKQIHRGEKIRTYNYNQDRCTDHRANFDVHNLPDVLEGGETLDRVMTAAKDWLVSRDIEMLTLEEEAKAKKAAAEKA
ncbi:Peptide chain release factor 1, mitochondrial [Amphichorda felina]